MFLSILTFFFVIYVAMLFARFFSMPLILIFPPAGYLVMVILWPIFILLYYLAS